MKYENVYNTELYSSREENQYYLNSNELLFQLGNSEQECKLLRENKSEMREFYDLMNKKEIEMRKKINVVKEEYKEQLQYNNQLREENLKLRNQLYSLVKKFEELCLQFQMITKKKIQLNDGIMGLRKECIAIVDSVLKKKGLLDSSIKKMQKELNLLMNFLKVRIINTGSIEEKKEIKAYLINIDKGLIKPFTATLSEPEGKRILSFWAEMYKFLVEEPISIKS